MRTTARFRVWAALLALGCGPSAQEIAAQVESPCAAISDIPFSFNDAEQDIFLETVTQRCGRETCIMFSIARRAGEPEDLLAAAQRLSSDEISAWVASGQNAECREATSVWRANLSMDRARLASAEEAPNWQDLLTALEEIPDLPNDLAEVVAPPSGIQGLYERCYEATSADSRRAERREDWGVAETSAGTALRCARSIPGSRRPDSRALSSLEELRATAAQRRERANARGRVCGLLSRARTEPTPDGLAARLRQILQALDEGLVDVTVGERRALESAITIANRTAGRCETRVERNDFCHERCVEASYRHGDYWLDRCMEHCDRRYRLCADLRGQREAHGEPASGVESPELETCRNYQPPAPEPEE